MYGWWCTPPPHRCTHAGRHAQPAGTGLWAQEGSQGPGGGEPGGKAAWRLLYPRLFSPGHQKPPKATSANGWIGSRSSPPQGGLSVQDLVGLSFTRSRPAIQPDFSRLQPASAGFISLSRLLQESHRIRPDSAEERRAKRGAARSSLRSSLCPEPVIRLKPDSLLSNTTWFGRNGRKLR